MKQLLLSSFTICLLASRLVAQEDPCFSEDKKYRKLLTTAMAEKTFEDQTEKFSQVMQKYPNVAETYYYYARICAGRAKQLKADDKTYNEGAVLEQKALLFYQNTIRKCPEFHAECYYLIANSLLVKNDLEHALPYMKKFVEFPQDDFSKLPDNYIQKQKEFQSIIDDLEFEKKLKENPVPFEPKRVEQVSSQLDEYFPMISPDNDLLFFTRKVDRKNLGDISSNIREEFSLASRQNASGPFSYGEPIAKPFNDGSFFNYGSATLSVDNKEMIVCACKVEKVYNQDYLNCDLYMTTYNRSGKGGNDFEWSPLVNLGTNINTKDGWEAQPSLSADGKTLFFATIRKGSRDNDIYFAERQKDGTFGPAKPFDIINTEGKDKSPFFHQDGETLYFVSSTSKKRKGLGGLDIFYIRKDGDKWTEPQNIGYPINSPDDELGLFVSTSGRVAYYSSAKDGNWNIFAFDLYETARPQEVVIVKGELTDNDGNALKDATVEITYNETGEKQQFKVNGDDGKYAAVVKVSKNQDVIVSVKKEGFSYNAQVIEKEKLVNVGKVESTVVKTGKLQIDSIVPGSAFVVGDIFFGTDSYELNDKSKRLLKGLAEYLKENEGLALSINGHTDDIGDNEKNRVLSQNRSDAVRNYLISLGIEATRLKAKGKGETEPKFPNTNETNRAKNRRTEFEVL